MDDSRFSAALGNRDDEDRRRAMLVAVPTSVASLRADGTAGPLLLDVGEGGVDRM